MEKKNSLIDSLVYIIACIASFGGVWVARIVITTAVRKALENQKKEKK